MTEEELLKKQAAEQAPPVQAFDVADIITDVKKTGKEQETLAVKEEKVIIEGADSEFWQIIKSRLDRRILALRGAAALRLGAGPLDLQNIGLRAIIVNEIADGYQEVVDLVEKAKKKRLLQIADEADPDKVEMSGEVNE